MSMAESNRFKIFYSPAGGSDSDSTDKFIGCFTICLKEKEQEVVLSASEFGELYATMESALEIAEQDDERLRAYFSEAKESEEQ
jgi:hypothetical protein